MKTALTAAIGTLAVLLLASGCTAGEKNPELKGLKEKVSYAIGLSIGRDFQAQEIEVDPELLLRGLKDGLAGKEGLMSEEQIQETQIAFQTEMMAKQETKMKAMADKNKQESEVFHADNAKKDGVVTLPSGLQYQVIEAGKGKSPKAEDMVTVHYEGTLIDGSVFDSSRMRGEPATFPVGGVIPGWTEALQLMKEGAKYRLFIPPALAYGERGAGPMIGPNATLVFEVELLKIDSQKK